MNECYERENKRAGRSYGTVILWEDIHTLNKRGRLSYFTQSIDKAFRHNRSYNKSLAPPLPYLILRKKREREERETTRYK